MALPPLLDAGSVAAIFVAIDRGYARWTQLRRNQMTIPETPEAPAADPYAGARSMGITVPAAPAPEAEAAEAVTVTPAATSPAAEPVTLPPVGPVQTPMSAKLRDVASDLIDVIQAIEAATE